MKILFAQDALVNAGAERSHLEILSRFSKELDVSFVHFYPKYDLKDAYERAGIRLFFLDIPESYNFSLAVYRLVRLIRQEKPDLLISSLWRADIITRVAAWITGVPLIGTLVNDSYSPIAWTDKKGLKYKVVYWLDRLTAGIPIHWIANAQALADSHVRTLGLSPQKISVVYRGRHVPKPPPRSVSPQTGTSIIPSPYGAPCPSGRTFPLLGGSPQTEITIRNFISYGRLLERKGFQDAISAFAQVLKTYPDCTLAIFGEGPYRRELERQIQYLGIESSVFLPGKIPNPMDALINGYCPLLISAEFSTGDVTGDFQLADHHSPLTTNDSRLPAESKLDPNPDLRPLLTAHCFLFPSWYEGFSGALVEAMMAGIPIIASDIPMNLEAVQHGKSALVFPVGNWEALADRMITAIENPKLMQDLGNQARSIAVQKFDIELIAKQYENLLRNIQQQNLKA